MADKKESALGAVTDFAQARVLDASGASKNISKADMAAVLAIASKSLTIKWGVNIDFNNIAESGIYIIGNLQSQTKNYPVASGAACLYIHAASGDTKWDLLIGIDAPLMYGRYSYTANLGTWVKLL